MPLRKYQLTIFPRVTLFTLQGFDKVGGTHVATLKFVKFWCTCACRAAGISQWTPLADMYTDMRHLRFADGPDEVHHMVVGRAELQKYDLW